MQRFEYKVIPAPTKGDKARGVKATPDRFALTLTMLMNELGRDGWDYVRADTLPCEERVGLTGSKTTYQNMLVFRRLITAETVMDPEVSLSILRAGYAEEAAAPRLGVSADAPMGVAPAIGPAKAGLAAE